jgi:hypothetical protein
MTFHTRQRPLHLLHIGLALVGAALPLLPSAHAQAPLDPQYNIAGQFVDNEGPAVQLANGRVYRLGTKHPQIVMRPPAGGRVPKQVIDQVNQSHPGSLPSWFLNPPKVNPKPNMPPVPKGGGQNGGAPTDRPAARSLVWDGGSGAQWLRRVQNPMFPSTFTIAGLAGRVRDQGATRDACTWFAAALAIEAAYLRRGVNVTLSPEYYNNIIKMLLLGPSPPLGATEIKVGLWGGGNLTTNFGAMLSRNFGIPEEAQDPYDPLNGVNNSTSRPAGDILNWPAANFTQLEVDAVDLSDQPIALVNPANHILTPLPIHAAANAVYRATAVEFASDLDRSNLDWYRQRLSSGQAIAITFDCCGDHTSSVWSPNGDLSAVHAAVLIGYDDSRHVFLLRNSWNENSARDFSYDFATLNHIREAAVVTDVAPITAKPSGLPDNLSVLLGRWLLTDTMQPGLVTTHGTGELDIYSLPMVQPTLSRLGTFFAADGTGYRVNGRFVVDPQNNPTGGLEFYIDPSQPDVSPTATMASGTHYVATHLFESTFGNEFAMMVGNADTPAGAKQSFVLHKTQPLPTSVPIPLSTARSSNSAMIGWWEIYWEDQAGTLVFSSFDSSNDKFVGYYQPFGSNQRVTAWGAVNGNGMIVLTNSPNVRLAIGTFANSTQSVAAGDFEPGNPDSAFVAVLRNPAPVIVIPAIGSTLGPPAP